MTGASTESPAEPRFKFAGKGRFMGKGDFARVAGATLLTLWDTGLVKTPADEMTERGFCSFDEVVAGRVNETRLPS